MAKKRVEAKIKAVEFSMEAMDAKVEIIADAPPQSDMWNIYRAIRKRLEAEDLTVNAPNPMLTQVRIEKDFVKDCMSMIPSMIGTPPEYPAWNFPALIRCIVPKGDNTALRLSILKDVVRKALIKEPIEMGPVRLSFIVTNEEDSRAQGVRMSALSILIRVDRIKKQRW